jgi:hypothetical protein
VLAHNRLRLVVVPFLLASAAVSLSSYAQSQDPQSSQTDSVAEAARRAREQKKAAGDKAVPVITDDILKPSAPQAPASSSDQAAADQKDAAPDAAKPEGAAGKDAGKEKESAELADAKQQLADAETALDIAKRELAVEQDNVYSKPDYQNDTAGQAKLDDLQQHINDKQQAVDDLKARVADLETKAGAPAPSSEEPPQTPPQP